MADNTTLNAQAGGDVIATDDIAGIKHQLVKLEYGAADSATQVSPANPLPVIDPDTTATGTITTQNLVPAGAATAGSAIEITLNGDSALTIQVTGTYTGALSLQGTIDGTTWVTLAGSPFLNVNTGGYLATITSALQSIFQTDVAGFNKARITGLAAMTGTATISLRASAATAMMALDAALPAGTNAIGIVDTELPAAAALADASANPTTPMVGSNMMQMGGSTWDRVMANNFTTTSDTGAKTVTYTGFAMTNRTNKGAYIYTLLGTVSGTTPTMSVQLQISYDGTTFINLGPASTNLTTTGQSHLLMVYPANVSQAAGATAANLTSGATVTTAINAPLPRSWKLVYTIGGTTPSFAITNTYVTYVN